MDRFIRYTAYFFGYAFLGWAFELVFTLFTIGHYPLGGLEGPWTPLYGFGMLAIIFFLKPLKHRPLLLFIGATLITSALELITGIGLMHFFQRRWWDYSQLPLNYNGFIDLYVSLVWGLLSSRLLLFLQPRLEAFIQRVPPALLRGVILGLLLLLAADTLWTFGGLFAQMQGRGVQGEGLGAARNGLKAGCPG